MQCGTGRRRVFFFPFEACTWQDAARHSVPLPACENMLCTHQNCHALNASGAHLMRPYVVEQQAPAGIQCDELTSASPIVLCSLATRATLRCQVMVKLLSKRVKSRLQCHARHAEEQSPHCNALLELAVAWNRPGAGPCGMLVQSLILRPQEDQSRFATVAVSAVDRRLHRNVVYIIASAVNVAKAKRK